MVTRADFSAGGESYHTWLPNDSEEAMKTVDRYSRRLRRRSSFSLYLLQVSVLQAWMWMLLCHGHNIVDFQLPFNIKMLDLGMKSDIFGLSQLSFEAGGTKPEV